MTSQKCHTRQLGLLVPSSCTCHGAHGCWRPSQSLTCRDQGMWHQVLLGSWGAEQVGLRPLYCLSSQRARNCSSATSKHHKGGLPDSSFSFLLQQNVQRGLVMYNHPAQVSIVTGKSTKCYQKVSTTIDLSPCIQPEKGWGQARKCSERASEVY